MAILVRAVRAGSHLVGAVDAGRLVGVALTVSALPGPASAPARATAPTSPEDELIALGVAPAWRRRGLAAALLAASAEDARERSVSLVARIGPGERDVIEPLPIAARHEIADRLLTGVGFARIPGGPDEGPVPLVAYRT